MHTIKKNGWKSGKQYGHALWRLIWLHTICSGLSASILTVNVAYEKNPCWSKKADNWYLHRHVPSQTTFFFRVSERGFRSLHTQNTRAQMVLLRLLSSSDSSSVIFSHSNRFYKWTRCFTI